jgi:hypothetical protein
MKLETEKPVQEEANQLSYIPRTTLGERLLAIRAKIVASGAPLLDPDEIDKEVAARRGGAQDDSV